jgi:hypothetical protein
MGFALSVKAVVPRGQIRCETIGLPVVVRVHRQRRRSTTREFRVLITGVRLAIPVERHQRRH